MYYTDKPKKNWIKIGSEMSQKTIDFDFPKFLDESYSEVPNMVFFPMQKGKNEILTPSEG